MRHLILWGPFLRKWYHFRPPLMVQQFNDFQWCNIMLKEMSDLRLMGTCPDECKTFNMEALWSHDDYGLFLCSEAVGRFSPNQTAPMFSLSLGWKTSVLTPKILSCENGALLQNSFKNLPVLQSCCDFPWPLESHLLKCDPLQSWVGSLATTSTTVEDRGAPEAKRYCSLKTYCLKYFFLKSHPSPFLTHPTMATGPDAVDWQSIKSLVFGGGVKQTVLDRWLQPFTFSSEVSWKFWLFERWPTWLSQEPAALVQGAGGPCAVLAPLQAFLLKVPHIF